MYGTRVLVSKKNDCKNCYKCIRYCPIKAIKFSDNQASIVEDECILCGKCYTVCPQSAKEIRNDVDKVKEMLAKEEDVFASIAPSFVANYENMNITAAENALKKLGFKGAEETAVGATIVKKEYDKMVNEGKKKIIISSCCHSVNTLIQKYYPEALPYLADIKSPMQAHCEKIKREHEGAKTVFIGPCISKKDEADKYPDIVDAVLTFKELDEWLAEEEIELCECEDKVAGGRARLFPTTTGILKSMDCDSKDYTYIAIDGIENCIAALEDIKNGEMKNCFIEMSACAGSCINGPVMSRNSEKLVKNTLAVNRYAPKDDFDVASPSTASLKKNISFVGVRKNMPGSKAIEEILHRMGKTRPEQELNCGSCGYDTCREKAVAVLQGKANLEMCMPYLKDKAESFSDTIIGNTPNGILVLNEDFEVQQINAAAKSIMNIKSSDDVLGNPVVRILDPSKFMQVLSSGRDIRNEKVYLADYNKYVEETIIYDKSYHIIIGIMRDVTESELEHEKRIEDAHNTVEITDKVIDKQMRVVQEIASLLGETTAETKIALTKLKENLTNE
ncbi:MAG: 4Fe-4S dicluster domain-containing protein [Ruminococcus sp.]|nr:4Fe-4S dicluster domain-containing protein [Ruminococcus sp.]